MEGNHVLSPQSRVLFAAAVFALVAVLIFILVWFWPQFFKFGSMGERQETPELSTEEKLAVLAQIRASEPEALAIPLAQKVDAMERVSDSSASPNMSEQEKLDVLEMLNAN